MASDGLWGDFDKSVAPAASASSAAPARGVWDDFDHPPPAPPPEPSLTDRLAAGISHIGDALKGVDLKAALGATGSQDYGQGLGYALDNPITRGLGQGANTAATGLNELIDRLLVKPADAGVSMLGGHSDLSGSFNRTAIAPGVANEAALSAPTSAGLGSAATQTGSNLLGSIATALSTGGADTAAPAAIHAAEPGLGSMLASAITSPQTRTAGILGTESAADQAAQGGAQGKPMGNADLANLALAHTAANLLPMGHGLPLLARPVVGAVSGVAGQALGDQASNQPADLSHYLTSAGTAALLSLIPGGHGMTPDLEAQLRRKYGNEAVDAAKAAMSQPAPDAARAAPSAIPDAEFTKALPEPVVAVDRAGTAMTSADFLAKAKQAQADAEATVAAGQQRADIGITPDIERTQGARWEAQQAAALDHQAHLDARASAQDELAQQGTDDTPPWWMGARGGELDHEATSMPQPAATPSAAAEATASSPVIPRAAAPVVDHASTDHPYIEPLRQEIGWDTVGGKMIRGGEVNSDLSSGAGFGRTSGDVVGRTPWVGKPGPQGESDFWRLRPIEGGKISEQGAHAAMDKAAAGEPLNAKERRFIDYARETAQHYDDAYQADLQQHQQDQADMDGSAKASAMQELHANGAEYDPADHAEAATISQLISRAHDAGATPRQMRDAIATGGKTDKARALWDLTRRLEATDGADRQAVQPGGRGGDEAPHERQAAVDPATQQPIEAHAHGGEAAASEVTPARPARDLFAAPTPAEHVRAATEARDAERNGQTGGKTDTRDGGLFDGKRPEQTRVPEALDSTDATRQASRDQGNADADHLGIRAAVTKALGPVADRVEYLHGYAGLPENMRKGVESRNALGRKGVTAAMYSPDTGRVFLFTDAVKTPERAVWHAAHEIAGHAGLRALLGDRLNPALGIALQNPTVKALADEIFQQRKIGEQMKQSGKSHADGLLLSAEEALAELGAAIRTDDFEHIKSRYGVDVPLGMRASVKAAIANFLRRLKAQIDDLFGKHTFSDEDVRSLMESAWQAAKESPASGKPGEAAMDRMAAEPHEVDSTEDQTDTPAFKRWFGESKVVDAQGKPLVVYHGTTADFSTFNRERANAESDFGAGFYFSNTSADVEHNYAGFGPDLTNKIEHEAERIAGETDREYDDPAVVAEARAKFVQHEGATMPVFLSIKKPVELGGKGETQWHMDFDEDSGDESGPLVDLHQALTALEGDFEDFDPQRAFNDATDAVGMDGSARDYIDALKKSEGMVYATDENGQLVSSEIVRQTLEGMGYDGVIDRSVNKKFGSERGTGKKMAGMSAGTVHYVAFEPNQVKSATGNNGNFDPAKPSILESLDHAGPATGVKNEQVASERRARGMDALDAEGKRTFGEVWDTARRKLDDNPQHGQVLAEQIAAHPRALNAEETAVLSQDRARIAVQRSTAAREAVEARSAGDTAGEAIAGEKLRLADEQMAVNDRAARSSGYEQGLGLAMRKAMAELDYSLGAMQQRLEASKGTPLTPEEHARLQKLHDAMDANAEALAAAEQKAKAPKAARDAKLTEGEARDRIRQAKRDLKDADATRNAVRQKQLRKDIVELELRMAKGEFEKGKRQPYAYNEATQQLLADRNFLRRKFDRMAAEAKHQASSKPHKLMSTLLSFRRAMLLSSIQTLGKLTAAASYRVALGPIEHGVQGALGQLPGLRGIAAKAPTEGRFSARAEGHALKQTFSRDTLRDMKAKLLHGEAVNDLLYGKFHASLHPLLELVGNVHAALKTPAERNAFARAQTLAAEHETRRVFDAGMSPAEVADHMASPATQALLGARAFEESQRAVLKNKNFVNSAYSMLHHALDNAGAEGGAERTAGKTTARVLDYVFPIVKVPTNFALESTSYALGAAKAAVQLIAAKGVKNLTPEQADYIMRNLGKQTIGAALMAIGWYNAKQVGTFYQSGDNKRHGRPEEGSAFGIPKWALDTPAGMLLTIGATMHRIDVGIPKSRGGIAKGTGGVGNAVLANVRGVASSVPFFGEPGRIASDFTSTDSLGKGLGKELASAIVPPDVRRLATHQDNGKKRDPKNFLDELKAGVPGLRQQVPEKHQRF